MDKWKAADAQAVAGYLESPTPETVLALVAQELKSEAPLVKAVAKGGERAAVGRAKRRLRAGSPSSSSVSASRPTATPARRLVALVGDDLAELESEIEKLATWAGKDSVGARDVELLAVHGREAPSWGLIGRVGLAGRRRGARRLRVRGDTAPSRSSSARGSRRTSRSSATRSALAADGTGTRDIAKKLGVHEFRVRKALGHADHYSPDELNDALVRLAGLDAALKGNSRRPADVELELALVDVTRKRERV